MNINAKYFESAKNKATALGMSTLWYLTYIRKPKYVCQWWVSGVFMFSRSLLLVDWATCKGSISELVGQQGYHDIEKIE